MAKPHLYAALLTFAAACTPPGAGAGAGATTAGGAAASTEDDVAIQRAEQDYLDLIVQIEPEEASQLGLHSRDGDLDDRSRGGFDKRIALQEGMLRDLRSRFEHPRASRTARTDLTVLENTLDADVQEQRAR